MQKYDIIIIGAGPAGASCAALLNNKGFSVCVLERANFPRFTLGESFLPQNMVYFEEAGLSDVFNESTFQMKDGAEFLCGDKRKTIDFKEKTSLGPQTTFQVKRDLFDSLVTDKIQKQGVTVLFEFEVLEVEFTQEDYPVLVRCKDLKTDNIIHLHSKFIVDASGLAKVLPKKLGLETEYEEHGRVTYFEHIKSNSPCEFDNNKILITVDKENRKNWFWTIPFGNNTYSLGLTTNETGLESSPEKVIQSFIDRNPHFKKALGTFEVISPGKKISGFSGKTPTKFGEHFVLIGNSGEFLDPIFSSGATVALKSASLAASLIEKKLAGEKVDWQEQYQEPLDIGLKTFSSFVNAWYDEDLQNVIFSDKVDTKLRGFIISILAGYAWDTSNPYTKNSTRRLKALSEICGDF